MLALMCRGWSTYVYVSSFSCRCIMFFFTHDGETKELHLTHHSQTTNSITINARTTHAPHIQDTRHILTKKGRARAWRVVTSEGEGRIMLSLYGTCLQGLWEATVTRPWNQNVVFAIVYNEIIAISKRYTAMSVLINWNFPK